MLLPAADQHKFDVVLQSEDKMSMNHLFRMLLGQYRNRILRVALERPAGNPAGAEARPEPLCRTRYQAKGLDLCRISLRFEESTWLELRILSFATGWSMSSILVAVVVWEYLRRSKFKKRGWIPLDYQVVGTPTANTICFHYNEANKGLNIAIHYSASEPYLYPPWYKTKL